MRWSCRRRLSWSEPAAVVKTLQCDLATRQLRVHGCCLGSASGWSSLIDLSLQADLLLAGRASVFVLDSPAALTKVGHKPHNTDTGKYQHSRDFTNRTGGASPPGLSGLSLSFNQVNWVVLLFVGWNVETLTSSFLNVFCSFICNSLFL